jgi:hypothetical protein
VGVLLDAKKIWMRRLAILMENNRPEKNDAVSFGAPPQAPRLFVLGLRPRPRACLFWGSAPGPAPVCFGAPPQAPRSFVAPFFLRLGGYEKIIGRRCAPIMPDDRRSADGFFLGDVIRVRELSRREGTSFAMGCLPNANSPLALLSERKHSHRGTEVTEGDNKYQL